MRMLCVLIVCGCMGWAGFAVEFGFDKEPEIAPDTGLDVLGDGKVWLRTMATPYSPDRREETYKVYTHIFDFDGKEPITKGPGGRFTHHRGMFIGWNKTILADRQFDTWHMSNCTQGLVEWKQLEAEAGAAVKEAQIDWRDDDGKAFIRETRRMTARPGENGMRIFDFESKLESLDGVIQLQGDLHHAGMQVRMANEVAEHEDTTQYILPEGAVEEANDQVVGAWWMCCSPVVREKRYWLIHMTPRTHPTGEPVYSIRRYARFGAFFTPELKQGEPLNLRFRVLVSERELDRDACQSLYEAYNAAK